MPMPVDREDLQGTLEPARRPYREALEQGPPGHGRFTRAYQVESVGADELGHTKQELYERAKELDIPRRSAMTKGELARAIARRQG
jgi:Rho termination factor, N-terminal domain